MIWLLACSAPEPEAWEGIAQAVVLADGRVLADRYSSRRGPGDTIVTKVDRCVGERCTLGPAARSVLMRLGDLVLDEEYTWEGLRSLSAVDPDTLTKPWTVPLGREPEGLVPGGSMFADGRGVLVFANHGLAGVEVGEAEGRAAFTIERWDDGVLSFRRKLDRYPDEAHFGAALAVHVDGDWRVLDPRTGEDRRTLPGRPGACLRDGRLVFLAPGGERVDVAVETGEVTVGAVFEAPGWVASCVPFAGEPVFHGGLDDGGGWLLGPTFPRLDVPRVDRQLDRHVDADGRWWVVELGRGWVLVDPVRREVVTPPRELHDVVRVGDHLLAYSVRTDLGMTLTTASGEIELANRVSPRPWHVLGDQLHTFPHREGSGGELGELVLRLPELTR